MTTVAKDALADVTPMLAALVEERSMAGAVTLAWQRGEIVHFGATGFRDVEAGLPMTRDALFRIASMTKPIVSLAALMLVEEGRLSLDAPIKRWLPELADRVVLDDPAGPLDRITPARDITVEDLLTHRSGLSEGFCSVGPIAEAYTEKLHRAASPGRTVDEWLAAVATLPLSHAPGTRFEYGCSTDVLGCLLVRIEGESLGAILKRRIFDPLGMHDTGFWVPPVKQDRVAHTYVAVPGALIDATGAVPDSPSAFESGAGGLWSTAADYLVFARMLLNGGIVEGGQLARPETIAAMYANRLTGEQRQGMFLGLGDFWAAQGFGLGLSTILDPASPLLEGPGSAGAFNWPGAYGTWWVADPEKEMILIYLAQDIFELKPETVGGLVTGERRGARSGRLDFQRLAYAALG